MHQAPTPLPCPVSLHAGGNCDACVKWTDKWAERLLPGGGRQQWGDKWREEFASGLGCKQGEVRVVMATVVVCVCVCVRFAVVGI
jgi:hypothetical protein